jgi:hypothetical protein
VAEHALELRADRGWAGKALPSETTLRRAMRAIDVEELEARLRRVVPLPAEDRPRWQGLAVDGKEVRDARAHGRIVHRVSLVRHDGVVLDQVAVDTKSNEVTAAPKLLAGRDLSGMGVTADALLAHRGFARQIRAQHGHYLFVITDNEPTTADAIATLFTTPPGGKASSRKRRGRWTRAMVGSRPGCWKRVRP